MKVPPFLLRRLYVKGSLTATADGFTFQLENKLGSGYAKRMLPLTLDGEPLDLAASTFEIDGEETAFDAVSESVPFTLAMNKDDDHLLPRRGSRAGAAQGRSGVRGRGARGTGLRLLRRGCRDGARRRVSAPRAVAVTGASGYIGTRLVRRLLETRDIERVTGVDVLPATIEHERYTHIQQDMTEPLDDAFRGGGGGRAPGVRAAAAPQAR